jgi:hypothetical protein
MKFGKAINYTIQVEPSANYGFIVTVGCARFAYTSIKELLADFEEFLVAPDNMEKKYNSRMLKSPLVVEEGYRGNVKL